MPDVQTRRQVTKLYLPIAAPVNQYLYGQSSVNGIFAAGVESGAKLWDD
ncbi:hypothetical protein L579_0310 [Pantoea sp. AS-PWVM4]|nr:hypothetical protein L579_0310 [Pantoea sp. AS-PWVM4]